MTFSGEEKGLLGSAYYVNHPLFPLDKTVFMVNFDMVGRLNEKDELSIFGVGSTPGAGELVDGARCIGRLQDQEDPWNVGWDRRQRPRVVLSQEHPDLVAFTGVHKDYHRPSDDSHLINYAGMSRIADFGELLLLDFSRRPRVPNSPRSGRGLPDTAKRLLPSPRSRQNPEHAQPAPKAKTRLAFQSPLTWVRYPTTTTKPKA